MSLKFNILIWFYVLFRIIVLVSLTPLVPSLKREKINKQQFSPRYILAEMDSLLKNQSYTFNCFPPREKAIFILHEYIFRFPIKDVLIYENKNCDM